MGGGCCVSNHPIRDFFRDLFCSDSCCVGHSSSRRDSEEHAKKVANELATMKENTEKTSTAIEQEIMADINASLDSFLRDIESENTKSYYGEYLKINVKAIREKNEQLNKQVIGCISNVMNRRLVQTDNELKVILEEKDDKKRKKSFEEFVSRVQRQALDKLKKEVEKTVRAQSEVVSKEIQGRQKEINKRLEETIAEMTEIMDVKQKSDIELERKQIDLMYQSSLCDYLLLECEG